MRTWPQFAPPRGDGKVTERFRRSKWLDLPVRTLVAVELAPGHHWSDEHRLLLPIPLA